jgi:hypothetical protein
MVSGRDMEEHPMTPFAINAKPRECGECQLCCKVMAIDAPELKKPKDTWCGFAQKKCGCSIYHGRPSVCRDFECLWLQGKFGGPENRPDKIHGVITTTTDHANIIIHEDPGYPGHASAVLKPFIEAWLAHGPRNYIVVVCGTNRRFLGTKERWQELQARGADEVSDIREVRVSERRQ